ncbi:MAG TPA: FAD:protein FMN transferase, partial [Terriglobia bacterium]|nr:FAD:protein FMN transferase [Terriglobia bacterium]
YPVRWELMVKDDSSIPIRTLQSVLTTFKVSTYSKVPTRVEIQEEIWPPSPQRGRAGGEGDNPELRVHTHRLWARKLAALVADLILLFPSIEFAQAADKLSRFEESQPHMGTVARIVLYAPGVEVATAATRSAFERIRELDSILSDYQRESELSGLSRQSGGPPVKIGSDLFRVLSVSQNEAGRSNGAFDVTVGPVIRLWRRGRRQRALPEADLLAAALDLTGFRWLTLDAKQQTAQLVKPGMLLDLGGIAKGYAADEGLKTLKRAGITQALVALGGDIAVSNPPPGKKGWSIEIASLNLPGAPRPRALLLHNEAVSTSGEAEQFVEIDGIRYSHIVDPRTGKALTGRRSVTVVATNGTDSDALATAVSVMGPDEGLKLIEATRGAAALIVVQTDSRIQTWKSKRWRE